jgi:hypothetical protein
MDHVVEIVSHLAFDVVRRPAQFPDIPDPITRKLESFRVRLGSDPDWPNAVQRGELFDLFLGSAFTSASFAFRQTVLRFVNGGSAANQAVHENAIIDSAISLRDLLEPTRQQATKTGARQLSTIFDEAVEILRCTEIKQAFGKFPETDQLWPLFTASSPNETQLIEEVFRQSGQQYSCHSWGRYYFLLLQRVAYYGRLTINCVLAAQDQDSTWLNTAIDSGYRWTRALDELLPTQTVIRAWTERKFKDRLSPQEKLHLPPNPVGEIDTSNAGLMPSALAIPQPLHYGQTFTVSGEVCCSTTPSVSCMSHCPPPDDIKIRAPGTYPCCTHHC